MAQRATSLGPKHFLFVFVCFVFWCCLYKKLHFPSEGAFLFIFQRLPLFLPSFCFTSPLHYLILCFFLLFPSLFSFYFVFVFPCFVILFICFVFHKQNNINILNFKMFQSILSVWGFPVLFCRSNSLSLSLLLSYCKLCFLFNIHVLSLKTSLKTLILVKRGVATCFNNLYFAKCEKVIAFAHVWPNFG